MSRLQWFLASCLLPCLFVPPAAFSQRYKVTEIKDLPNGYGLSATGINRFGQVTGSSAVLQFFPVADLILYSKGTTYDLGAPVVDADTVGKAINNSGQIAGFWVDERTAHAFLYSNGVFTDLGELIPNSMAVYGLSLNNSGQVTGYADIDGSGGSHAFLYEKGVMKDLGTPISGYSSSGYGINNRGHVTGYAYNGIDYHAFLYKDGGIQVLQLGAYPSGTQTQGMAINDRDEIAGSLLTADAHWHAAIFSRGKVRVLGVLRGTTESFADAINQCGDVVGDSYNPTTALQRPFVYTRGKVRDLNHLIPEDTGWTLLTASGINAKGQIVAQGTSDDNDQIVHSFLLTPIRHKSRRDNWRRDREDCSRDQTRVDEDPVAQ